MFLGIEVVLIVILFILFFLGLSKLVIYFWPKVFKISSDLEGNSLETVYKNKKNADVQLKASVDSMKKEVKEKSKLIKDVVKNRSKRSVN